MHAGDPDHHRTEACRPGEWSFVMSREVVGDHRRSFSFLGFPN